MFLLEAQEQRQELEQAWTRWLDFSSYAREQEHNQKFFKHWCLYVTAIWNKAIVDAFLLTQMFIGSSFWQTEKIDPMVNHNIEHWMRVFGEDVLEIVQASDLGLHRSLQAFLFEEYRRIGRNHSIPLKSQGGLAIKQLPKPPKLSLWEIAEEKDL